MVGGSGIEIDVGGTERGVNSKGEEGGREQRRDFSGFVQDRMEEDKSGGGDRASSSSSFLAVGDRQRFSVELRPGETTIVSWRKLVKDSNKLNGSPSAPEPPPANAHPALESRIAPGQASEKELKDEPAPNRFSAVIEKIERLYMGKDSSDDEDLNDLPDENQYDTEDSFIDDAELDEYFEVDKSATKHNGFFVNRGKLERINEPTLPNQKMKKRRRKDLMKSHGESDINEPNKHIKLAKAAGRSEEPAPTIRKYSSNPSQSVALKSEQIDDVKVPNQLNASVAHAKKKPADTRVALDPSISSKVSNGDVSLSLAEAKDPEKQKHGVHQSKHPGNKVKDARAFSDGAHQKYHDRSSHAQMKPKSGKQLSGADEHELAARAKEKCGVRELPDLNIPQVYPMQTAKTQHTIRKEGSSIRPKITMLEKAIRELEKIVAESRPPTIEVQDADTSSQAVKRRLPPEIKQKLAKVARLAQSTHGKISKELINRLNSILGHLIQLRTLKNNLKIMINTSLSAKQEKEYRFQQTKNEVAEIIKMQFSTVKPKASEHLGGSDDFQEAAVEEKTDLKRKSSMDSAMEDKICDLYDLYVDGLDEDAGPQIRKLYAELAEMWPNGLMDKHGIKRAICRAKDRKKVLYKRQLDSDKAEKKKLVPRTEESVKVEAGLVAHPQHVRERLATDTGNQGLASSSRSISSATAAVRMPSPLISGAAIERPKLEKAKGSSGTAFADDAKVTEAALVKKKVKRKPETESGSDGHSRLDKLPVAPQQVEDKHKPQKHVPTKPNVQLPPNPSDEQLS